MSLEEDEDSGDGREEQSRMIEKMPASNRHVVGLDQCGAIVLRQKWSRGQIEVRLANISPCLIGMEACVGAHHLSRKLQSHGHDARLMPAKYVRPYSTSNAPANGYSLLGLDCAFINFETSAF